MPQYFEYDPNLKSERKQISFNILGERFVLTSDNGVFSKDELDEGTKTLIETSYKYGLYGDVLDLGCGIGTVGIVLKKVQNNLNFTLVDIQKNAILLAKENVEKSGLKDVEVFESDIVKSIEKTYDFVLTNPPIRAGKNTVYAFFDGAYKVLKKDGKLIVVIRKSHGAPSAKIYLEKLFGNCEILKRNKGFYILKSEKSV